MVSDKEKLPAPRAATPLQLEQSQAKVVQWWGCRSPPPTGPVLGQGWVIRRRPHLDQPVSDDLRPGMLDQVGAAGAVAEHPVVLPGLIEPAEVPVDDPVLRFLRVTCAWPTCRRASTHSGQAQRISGWT